MACAVQSVGPQPVHDRPYSAGENCGAAGLPAVKEPDKPAEQAPERVERTPSPDTREDAGASSGESNTQKVNLHEGSPRHEVKISEPADPSGLAPSRGSGRGETAEKVTAGKDGKHGKLPRPEGTTPCPRCDSTDTKFCYYNNYNVKQPRYFCKGCQRYWTAGGTLRNVPVGAGRRKNKASAAKEAARDPSRKPASSKDSMEPSFMSFPVMDPSLAAYGAGPMIPGKAGIPGFVPNLNVHSQLSPLAMAPYPAVDPTAASRLAAALDVPQPSFGAPSMVPSMSGQRTGSDLSEDGSAGARRVRPRRCGSLAHPADSGLAQGSVSTLTDLRGAGARGASSAHGSTGLHPRSALEHGGSGHGLGSAVPTDSNGGSSFQPFHGGAGSAGGGGGYSQMPVSAGMQPDWMSMAAAAGQQQAVAAQHQLQYQAAAMQAQAMQAQAMQAAAANAAWGQGNNPYLSGLCFPYNLYGAAAAPQQLYAAYASLTPQASPWGAMDSAAAGNLPAPGQAGSNGTSVVVPTSQPSPAGWGMGGSLGEGAGQPISGQQQWAAHSRGHSGLRDASGATMWPAWPANNGELTAENKAHMSKHTKFGGMGLPTALHGNHAGSILSGSSNSSLTADLHNGVHRPTPSFNTAG